METILCSDFQIYALMIGWACSHIFMPIVLYEAWKSNKYRRPFEFRGMDCWVFPAFWMSLISILITFAFVTIPAIVR